MHTEIINERIKVGAVFDGAIKPRWFCWKGRKYLVKDITYTWRVCESGGESVNFAVTDGTDFFDIRFDKNKLSWALEKVHTE